MTKAANVPDFVAVGHVTHDRVNGGLRLGGAALYATVTAHRLGKRAAIVTSYGEDFTGGDVLADIPAAVVPAPQTSTFKNAYRNGERVQCIYGAAGELRAVSVPEGWRAAPIFYLCPVLHEIPPGLERHLQASLIGVAPQGWMRAWDEEGRIRCRRWTGFEGLVRRAGLVIVSEKDVEGNEDLVDAFRRLAAVVIVTRAREGARLYARDRTLDLGAYPAEEHDPTGAGDCFGAAFLIRLTETGDLGEAARFASCVGAFVVEREGIHGIPSRRDVQERMSRYVLPFEERPAEPASGTPAR